MFDSCLRRYYFHYYLSWGGWERQAPRIAREAFRLKRLTSLPLWRGQLVHYIATKVLASLRAKGRIPAFEDVSRYTLERFETQLDFSSYKEISHRAEKEERPPQHRLAGPLRARVRPADPSGKTAEDEG